MDEVKGGAVTKIKPAGKHSQSDRFSPKATFL